MEFYYHQIFGLQYYPVLTPQKGNFLWSDEGKEEVKWYPSKKGSLTILNNSRKIYTNS